MRQRKDVCRNAQRGALDPRHARLPNLTLRYRAGSAVVHLTTTPRLVPSHPSPRVKSYHGVLVRAPRTSRILQLAGLDVSVPGVHVSFCACRWRGEIVNGGIPDSLVMWDGFGALESGICPGGTGSWMGRRPC